MAYSTSAPPSMLTNRIGGQGAIWHYQSVDAAAVVRGANYFTNGLELGMKVGDVVYHQDTDAAPNTVGVSCVTESSSDGATVAALT
jgi:hypothetical protein